MGGSRGHWEDVYAAKSETAVSWYQPHSVRSLELIERAAPDRGAAVIDVGGGASTLVDDLIGRGFSDLTVLDIAPAALERSKARLRKAAAKVTWIVGDITHWTPPRTWDVWHDRAVFHFLTERAKQLRRGLDGRDAVGSDGYRRDLRPRRPGDMQRPSRPALQPGTLARRLGSAFELTGQASETHKTPSGSEQPFSYAVLRRL